jgi:hypothetical protein
VLQKSLWGHISKISPKTFEKIKDIWVDTGGSFDGKGNRVGMSTACSNQNVRADSSIFLNWLINAELATIVGILKFRLNKSTVQPAVICCYKYHESLSA